MKSLRRPNLFWSLIIASVVAGLTLMVGPTSSVRDPWVICLLAICIAGVTSLVPLALRVRECWRNSRATPESGIAASVAGILLIGLPVMVSGLVYADLVPVAAFTALGSFLVLAELLLQMCVTRTRCTA